MTKKIPLPIPAAISAIVFLLAAAVVAFADVKAVSAIDSLGIEGAKDIKDAGDAKGSASAKAASNIRKVFVIPVSGPVDYSMAAFIGRSISEAAKNDNSLIVLDIDTFGGQVDAAFTIVDSITASRAPTIAFVKSKAISAGALIALAADQLVMRPNTTIGDVAPLINTSEGPKMLGEKHQSPIRAKFRTLARKNGYPEVLTEAMVTEEIAVFQITLPDTVLYLDSVRIAALDPKVKKTVKSAKMVVRPGELLTMTETEAKEYGFSKMTVESINEMLREMGHADAEVVGIGKNWSEKLVSLIGVLAPILMMIGFACLYIEMRSPGFGFLGLTGIICLAIVFFGQYAVGLANYTEMLLLALGAVFLAIEIFVTPGLIVFGALGIILMVIGIALSFQNFVLPSPEIPWQAGVLKRNILRLSISILGSITLIFIFFRYLIEPLGRVVKGPYLAATLGDAQSTEGMAFVPKVGDRGVASTSLRPSGKVHIGKDMCDVVTEGQFIDNGTVVEVVQIHGNRIVVAAAAES